MRLLRVLVRFFGLNKKPRGWVPPAKYTPRIRGTQPGITAMVGRGVAPPQE